MARLQDGHCHVMVPLSFDAVTTSGITAPLARDGGGADSIAPAMLDSDSIATAVRAWNAGLLVLPDDILRRPDRTGLLSQLAAAG